MTPISDRMTVGEIAAQLPASVRVFEKHNIDFCCGGKVALADACRSRGIAPESLLGEIHDSAAPAPGKDTDWRKAPVNDLIDHILNRHHAFLKSELPRMEALLGKLVARHGGKYGEAPDRLQRVFAPLKDELDSHLMKEEMVLFPLIRGMALAEEGGSDAPPSHCGSVRNPIRVMQFEHDGAGEALQQLRQITGDYTLPDGACNTMRAVYDGLQELESDLHRHIHLENNILFPRAVELEGKM